MTWFVLPKALEYKRLKVSGDRIFVFGGCVDDLRSNISKNSFFVITPAACGALYGAVKNELPDQELKGRRSLIISESFWGWSISLSLLTVSSHFLGYPSLFQFAVSYFLTMVHGDARDTLELLVLSS